MPLSDKRPFGVCDCFFFAAFCRGKARVACDACPNCEIVLYRDCRTKLNSSVRYLTYIDRIFSFATGTFAQPGAFFHLVDRGDPPAPYFVVAKDQPDDWQEGRAFSILRGPRASAPSKSDSSQTKPVSASRTPTEAA
jgi:hypothetical protein